MSKTPRTDGLAYNLWRSWPPNTVRVVDVDDARKLETELYEAQATIKRLQSCIDEMQNEQAAICAENESITEHVGRLRSEIERMREALAKVSDTMNNSYSMTDAEFMVEMEKQEPAIASLLAEKEVK